jgi:hypothetical protein
MTLLLPTAKEEAIEVESTVVFQMRLPVGSTMTTWPLKSAATMLFPTRAGDEKTVPLRAKVQAREPTAVKE